MELNGAALMLTLFCGLAIILIVIGVLIKISTTKKLDRCTTKTIGEVVGFSSRGNGVWLPVVQYEVNGKNYKGKLIYRAVYQKKSLAYKDAEVTSDKFDQSLHIKRNSAFFTNPMQELFPIGSSLDVYYNKEKPKENFVQRRPKSLISVIFIGLGIGYIILGIILFMIFGNK